MSASHMDADLGLVTGLEQWKINKHGIRGSLVSILVLVHWRFFLSNVPGI